ncbi:MAG: flagellar basal body L-ring protein FlgH [Hydrogenophaga sp.]|uniref:flagellar basal body L-ring protein FlgH n=1 Tax=Hydrogenophaga sp. TaxID=1904254 RepID=UPI00169BD7DF|nr:flagellar basal body L-ring protein FlgH [Hydrogenophaga sp.]NIM41658.1 flagellar basal body L-ring protein FlgH [Hydrogenophaga sp.]NIN26963.1 flagellar basal body L-ring protein FlgH [Hydrogenophaga sp.]NIN31664.1 flagellar basal body L-ring protein FlgH [Hydrogenophaga sp.]NIN55908.1 flagellar basal body L-ring protein FlgH [Hydrogenophaga sp.]NIO52035.1 flagellar basal body L-ring protein FlgH [Hydrogenophaga sp.]
MMRIAPLMALLALAVLASGCQTLRNEPVVDLAPAQPVQYAQQAQAAQTASAPPTGSLFRAVTYRPAFEDPRARLPGDIVTIQITERVTASQSNSASIERSADASASINAIPLFGGSAPWNKANLGAQSDNNFSGDGRTTSNNTFTGAITATVQEVLPNGHLRVVGEKQIGVNANVDVLRFSGTVDPRHLRPGNVVPSTQVADARIESRSRGAQGEAMSIGWLARFFLSVLPF